MKAPTRQLLIPLLLFLAVTIVALNAWFAFRSVNVLIASEAWVQHTWQVIYQAERILGSAKDAETGTRGFIISGEEAYLAPYQAAQHDLPGELNEFASLTADNSSQQLRIAEMRVLVTQRLAALTRVVELRRRNQVESIVSMIHTGSGRKQMDRLRLLADAMEGEERRLLALRTAANRYNSRRAQFSIGLATSLDLLLIVLMARYLARERGLRLATEQAAGGLALAHAETEAKAAEVLALNATLEERVRSRTAELEATNRELEAFSYSVSHDLRSPLRTIDGFSLALEEDYAAVLDEAGRDYIRRVRNGVQRMGQLIDALLQLSRITRAEINRQEVDITELAGLIARDLVEANPAGAPVFHIAAGLSASADPKLLLVALENLMGNAVKFSSKVASPLVDVGWDAQQSAWFVKDNGAGFDMYYADKLFNAFNRLHGDKDFKGSGIGLATVARVVHRHHGRIWAHGTVDHGATFWFTLG